MMRHISLLILLVFGLLVSSRAALSKGMEINSKAIERCLEEAGGSARLISYCYINAAKTYQNEAKKQYKELESTIPKASLPLLNKYRQAMQDVSGTCPIMFQAANNWEKSDEPYVTLAKVAKDECVYKTKKQEYETYVKLLCKSGDCW